MRELIEATTYAVISTDPQGVIRGFDRSAEKLLGFDASEVVGRLTPASFHLASELEKRAAELKQHLGHPVSPTLEVFAVQALELDAPGETPWTYVRKDGSHVSVLLSVTPLKDSKNALVGFVAIVRDATEIRRIEAEAKRREERFKVVFNASPDGMFLVGHDGRIADCNPALLAMLGYEEFEIVGSSANELLHLEARSPLHSLVDGLRPPVPGTAPRREVIAKRKDSSLFPAELSTTEIPGRDGCPSTFVGKLRDISLQKEREEERERLLKIIDATPDFIGVSDMQGRIIFQNKAGNRRVGWAEDEDVRGRQIPDVHPSWAAEKVRGQGIPHAIKHGSWIGESALRDLDGQEIPVSQVIIAHRDSEGKPEFLSTIMRDLSAERRVQSLLAKVMRHVPGVVYQFQMAPDGGATFPFTSSAVTDLLGVTSEEAALSAETVFAHIHEDDVHRVQGEVATSAATLQPWRSEFRYRHQDGSLRHYLGQSNPEKLPDGSHLWHGFISDISSEVLIREQLKEAAARANAATKAKGAFLATMSHEIRTPLNGVLGMAEVLATSALDEEQSECVQLIRSSGDNLLTLINDILDYSRLESGKLTLEKIPFSPLELCEESINLYQEAASKKGVRLRLDSSGVPADFLLGDPTRLRQITLNLISNAVKFTEDGDVSVGLAIHAHSGSEKNLEIRVSDTGIGMTPEQLAVVGEAFTQADASTTRQFGGTGLGLSICFGLTEQLGGTLKVESEPGQGSNFTLSIILPRTERVTSRPPSAQELWGSKKKLARVLVAEDNRTNQRLVQLILRDYAEQIDLVENGEEAVARSADTEYDLILMDGHMPKMDGKQATRAIRLRENVEKKRHVPIVALTADALEGHREEFLDAGMDGYLSKPLRAAELVKTLGSVLGSSHES